MGQQLRTNTKRRRRKDYLKRKKEQARLSAAVKKSAPKKAKAEKAPAKKAAKKVAKKAVKKVAKKVAEKVPAADQDLGKVYDKAPDQVDDLKEISGVGPALEAKLHGFGIYTYAQIAAWTPENITAFDDLLSFKGRIERDDWLKQATDFEAAK